MMKGKEQLLQEQGNKLEWHKEKREMNDLFGCLCGFLVRENLERFLVFLFSIISGTDLQLSFRQASCIKLPLVKLYIGSRKKKH
jgi:hypothetical protein